MKVRLSCLASLMFLSLVSTPMLSLAQNSGEGIRDLSVDDELMAEVLPEIITDYNSFPNSGVGGVVPEGAEAGCNPPIRPGIPRIFTLQELYAKCVTACYYVLGPSGPQLVGCLADCKTIVKTIPNSATLCPI